MNVATSAISGSINLPNVPVEAVNGFAKVWKSPGGLSLMLDDVTRQFALDFSRVVLRNFIVENMKAQAAAQKSKAPVPEIPKSSIILTD